jgi:hypothetical protein
MKTTFFVLIGVGSLLLIAGQSASAADRHIDIVFNHTGPGSADTNTNWNVHWEMKENTNGAFHLHRVYSNDIIKWVCDGPFSIVVTNKDEWTVVLAGQPSWRSNVSCPFNETNVGVIDSTNLGGHMVVHLKVGPGLKQTVGYLVAVPTVPAIPGQGPHSRMPAANDFSMVDATMDWTGLFKK